MYEYLTGIITKITPTYIVLDVSGIGYLLNVANPYSWQLQDEKQIFVHQVVREDALTLYGFASEEEKQVFLRLISVSGIGPKSALAIIAADDNAGLVAAIDSSNVTYLTKFPGVGKKTASQMVLDLAGKFVAADVPVKTAANPELAEAVEALEALGYKAAELKKIEKKLEAEGAMQTDEYIKLALRMLIK
ncbi:MAG: Holliday junction branch migration protein RuvA [Streptococcaceae bacterium]|jgi:Holliday junction DNA helicase RuvA|nr:Holliday junction branch migration protein RuvA [Streptococcaceae bacterium]